MLIRTSAAAAESSSLFFTAFDDPSFSPLSSPPFAAVTVTVTASSFTSVLSSFFRASFDDCDMEMSLCDFIVTEEETMGDVECATDGTPETGP